MIMKENALFLGRRLVNSAKTGKTYNSLWFALESGGAYKSFAEDGTAPEVEKLCDSLGWGSRVQLEIELRFREDAECNFNLLSVKPLKS